MLFLTVVCAQPLAAQQAGPGGGLRFGPHDVAARPATGTAAEVWYPADCGRRAMPTRPCAAPPDSGVFPLLVYRVVPEGADARDTAIVAYFTSHGYAVAWSRGGGSLDDARAARSLPFVDSTRGALLGWGDVQVVGSPAAWRIAAVAPCTGAGVLRLTIEAGHGPRMVEIELPSVADRDRLRLVAALCHRFMDAVLRGWGEPPDALVRRLDAMGLRVRH